MSSTKHHGDPQFTVYASHVKITSRCGSTQHKSRFQTEDSELSVASSALHVYKELRLIGSESSDSVLAQGDAGQGGKKEVSRAAAGAGASDARQS